MEWIVILLLAKKENVTQEIWPIVLGIHDYSSTWLTNNYDTIFIIIGSLSHNNPPLNIDLPLILIFLISYNIAFNPSHPHKIDIKVYKPHKNKITNKQVT